MSDSLSLVRCLIANVWNFLLGVQVPGIGISFAAFFIAIFLVSAGIYLFRSALGSAGNDFSGSAFSRRDPKG